MDEARGKLAALGIEMDATMKRFCGDTDLLVEMLREFAAEDLLERLPAAIAESDGAAIERAAHAVNGTSANLGLHGAECALRQGGPGGACGLARRHRGVGRGGAGVLPGRSRGHRRSLI